LDVAGGAGGEDEALELAGWAIGVKDDWAATNTFLEGDLDELSAVEGGHTGVDEDEVGLFAGDGCAEAEGGVEGDDLEAARLKEEFHELTTDFAVVHHEDSSLRSAHRRPFVGTARASRCISRAILSPCLAAGKMLALSWGPAEPCSAEQLGAYEEYFAAADEDDLGGAIVRSGADACGDARERLASAEQREALFAAPYLDAHAFSGGL